MIPLLGLLAGIVLGIVLEPSIPQVLQPYLPIAIVAAMDALFGAFRAYLEGTFTDRVFVVSFISNVLIAAAIVYVGRPDRRRLTTSDRGRGGPRNPHLHQCRCDQAGALPCLTRHASMAATAGAVPAAPRPHARSRNAVSRRVSSLRRSQRRLAGEEHPTAGSRGRAPLASADPGVTGQPTEPAAARQHPRSATGITAASGSGADPGGGHLVRRRCGRCHADPDQRRRATPMRRHDVRI